MISPEFLGGTTSNRHKAKGAGQFRSGGFGVIRSIHFAVISCKRNNAGQAGSGRAGSEQVTHREMSLERRAMVNIDF